MDTIRMSSSQLRQVQIILLELMCEVKRICQKENIHYNIIAGTLLGAVRHGGFIPWDDDADIAMFRPEYEKFRVACTRELDKNKFYFQDHTVTAGYRWGYGKLRRVGTTFLRHGQEHMPYEQGVFIDIFPLDTVPEQPWRRYVHNLHCDLIRKIMWAEVGRLVDKNIFLRLIYAVLAKIPFKCVAAHYEKFMRKCNKLESKWVRILTFPTPNTRYGYLRRWYENSGEYVFEGEAFSGVKNFDEYLKFKFGDWRELPPEEQRKTHPVSKIRLM